jgi:hypothetical protein
MAPRRKRVGAGGAHFGFRVASVSRPSCRGAADRRRRQNHDPCRQGHPPRRGRHRTAHRPGPRPLPSPDAEPISPPKIARTVSATSSAWHGPRARSTTQDEAGPSAKSCGSERTKGQRIGSEKPTATGDHQNHHPRSPSTSSSKNLTTTTRVPDRGAVEWNLLSPRGKWITSNIAIPHSEGWPLTQVARSQGLSLPTTKRLLDELRYEIEAQLGFPPTIDCQPQPSACVECRRATEKVSRLGLVPEVLRAGVSGAKGRADGTVTRGRYADVAR